MTGASPDLGMQRNKVEHLGRDMQVTGYAVMLTEKGAELARFAFHFARLGRELVFEVEQAFVIVTQGTHRAVRDGMGGL